MDPLLEGAEVLLAVVAVDHDLAVDHVAPGRERDLGEVAPERLGAARLEHQLVAVDEGDRAEAVEFRLVAPLLAERQLLGGAGELGLDRRLERQCHGQRSYPADAASLRSEAMATAAEQEYLESLFWLYEAGLPMTGANLARAMRLSAPTVHEMLGRLERDGYVARNSGRAIEFTDRRARARREDRRPPPDDRALPDRRRRRPVGRRARGGREARVRDDAAVRGLRARRRRRRRRRARTATRSASASGSTGSRWPTARSAPRSRSCGSRTRPRTCCTTSSRPGSSPA